MPDDHYRVLVIDDDPAIRSLLVTLLGDEGYEVVEASNGEEGLLLVESRPPDLVLLDLSMPVMDGRTFYRTLQERGRHLPVIIVSAVGATATQAELGAEAAIAKPFDLDEVVAQVERFSELSSAG